MSTLRYALQLLVLYGLGYSIFLYKKWKNKANKAESDFQEFKNISLTEIKNNFEASYSKQYEKFKEDTEHSYNKQFEELKENLELEYKDKLEQNESELEAALAEANTELETTIKSVDEIIGIKVQELIDKCTLWMKCACSDKLIPCEMDLSKPDENTFKCPDCGAVYRVQFSYYPVLIKREINDNQLVSILEKNKQKGEENNG